MHWLHSTGEGATAISHDESRERAELGKQDGDVYLLVTGQ